MVNTTRRKIVQPPEQPTPKSYCSQPPLTQFNSTPPTTPTYLKVVVVQQPKGCLEILRFVPQHHLRTRPVLNPLRLPQTNVRILITRPNLLLKNPIRPQFPLPVCLPLHVTSRLPSASLVPLPLFTNLTYLPRPYI